MYIYIYIHIYILIFMYITLYIFIIYNVVTSCLTGFLPQPHRTFLVPQVYSPPASGRVLRSQHSRAPLAGHHHWFFGSADPKTAGSVAETKTACSDTMHLCVIYINIKIKNSPNYTIYNFPQITNYELWNWYILQNRNSVFRFFQIFQNFECILVLLVYFV